MRSSRVRPGRPRQSRPHCNRIPPPPPPYRVAVVAAAVHPLAVGQERHARAGPGAVVEPVRAHPQQPQQRLPRAPSVMTRPRPPPPGTPPSGPRPAVAASGYRTRATHSSVRAPPQAAPAGAQRVSRSRTRACQALTSVSLINRLAESTEVGLITQPFLCRITPLFGSVIFSSPCVAAPHSGRQSAENIFRAGAAHAPGQGHTDRQAATEA